MRLKGVRRNRAAVAAVAGGALVLVIAGCSTADHSSSRESESATAASQTSAASPPQMPPTAVPPSPTPIFRPPYIDHVDWVQTTAGRSLQIHPTLSGRHTDDPAGANIAWSEVLKLAPDAQTPGMRAQFDCHWTYARLVEPDKPSWNIEPWRPVVTEQVMVQTRCNPGGPEE